MSSKPLRKAIIAIGAFAVSASVSAMQPMSPHAAGITRGVVAPEQGEMRADGRFLASGKAAVLYQPDYRAKKADPETMAREFLAARRVRLGLTTEDLSGLQRSHLRDGQRFSVVRFTQTRQGLPVYGSDIAVSVMRDGRVIYVTNDSVADIGSADLAAGKSQAQAIDIARAYLGFGGLSQQGAQRMIYVAEGRTRVVWRVSAVAEGGSFGDWEILVDAHTGEVVRAEDKGLYADGTATVWGPDPLSSARVAYGTPGYVDGNNADTPELTAELQDVILQEMTLSGGTYSLSGPWAVCADFEAPTGDGGCPTSTTGDFSMTRSAAGFDGVMGYYHLTTIMKYVNQTLGVEAMPINHPGGVVFDPHGFSGADNSHFVGSSERLAFGQGGVDDAQDADVLAHELGHGLHFFVTGGHLSQTQGLSEGVGDYMAGSYSRTWPNQWTPADAAYFWTYNWDGHNTFWSGRILNFQLNHSYPSNIGSDFYTQSQYWSSCNAHASDVLDRQDMDRAFLEGLSMTGASTNQKDAAQAVINAAAALGYTAQQIADLATVYNDGQAGDLNCTYDVTVPSVEEPVVDVDPASIAATAEEGATATSTLTIDNTGGSSLDWTIDTSASADCSTSDPVAWLSFTPANGSTTGGNGSDVTLTFDAGSLAVGEYATNACVHSNDAQTPVIAVPVTFAVTQRDAIFVDGFDGGGTGACEPAQLLQDPSFEATAGSGGLNDFWDSQTTQGDTVFWGDDADTKHIRTGSYVVWLGGYGTSTPETHDASQAVVIPAGSPRYLNYWRWISTVSGGTNLVTFTVDGDTVATEDLTALGADGDWTPQSIDVGAYADGASHTVKVTYTFSGGASDASYYIDDMTLDCSATPATAPARPATPVGAGTRALKHRP
jgi:hypothetical protein